MLFKFALNVSHIRQTFFTHISSYITIEPNQVVDTTVICGSTNHVLQPIDSFLSILDKHKIKRFYLQRTYALGDILMLVPLVRALRKQGFDPYVRTVRWAQVILNLLEIEVAVAESMNPPPVKEYGIMLDGILEQDHSRLELSELHRVDIYFYALGIRKMPKNLDWRLNLEKLPKINIEDDYVCFQGAGSNKMKQLPLNSINYMRERFKEKGIKVIMIGEGNRKSIKELFALIANAKVLITMDSAPLWIAHFTQTPIVALLGATRASERLSRHSLYPKKAVGVALNEEINCPSCFHQARKCSGRVDCLKIGPEKIFDLVYSEVKRIMES